MGHPLQISRRTEYGLRAMVYLASKPQSAVVPFREIAVRMDVPQDFLAKILKKLVKERLAVSSRGARGGYSLGRPATEISMLDVIEAVEGPVQVNLCTDGGDNTHDGCAFTGACTMYGVWRLGQQRMIEVYRHAKLDKLAMAGLQAEADAEQRAAQPAVDLRRAALS
ncbi:MAG: Rrf2 family transcriptional regulator [Myxococcaceae bacterium]